MYIYIDESGLFTNPKKLSNYVSCMGALIIPEDIHDNLIEDFCKFKKNINHSKQEIKGSHLDEKQVNDLINLLLRYDIIFYACAVDIGIQNEEDINHHKSKQADNFVKNITSNFHPNLIKGLNSVRERLLKLNNQLYVQVICLNELIHNSIQLSTLYYSQRKAKTLESFKWRIDRKHKKVTEYESIWKQVILPLIQSMSLKKPLLCYEKGNYKYFERYARPGNTPPEYLKKYINFDEKKEVFNSIDPKKLIMEDIIFCDSVDNTGIQIIDMLITNLRRGFNGKLQIEGWKNIGKIMIQPMVRSNSIKFITFSDLKNTQPLPYQILFNMTNKFSKQMILE